MTSMLDTLAWCAQLDRSAATPLYQQLCDSLRTAITAMYSATPPSALKSLCSS